MAGAAVVLAATLALTNGKIWTGNGFKKSVVIDGNRIAAIDTAPPADAKVIDLQGRLVVPGFIDNHVHFISSSMQLSFVKLRDAATPEEFARRIGAQAKKLGKGAWVTGGEWDEQLWEPYRLPTKEMIDAATPDNPVFVSRLDGHMALGNSVTLKLAGITRETPDPPGGTIVRDGHGQPTGLLKDAAMNLVFAVVPPASLEQRVDGAKAGLREAARLGVTSFCDMSDGDVAFDHFRAYQQIERDGGLTARVYLFAPVAEYGRLKAAGIEKRFGSDRLRIGGLKGFADGSLGSSTAYFYEPFIDDPAGAGPAGTGEPDNRGLAMEALTNGAMARWIADADASNLHIATHAIGDRANAEVLSIYESRPNYKERRFRIEHAQHLDPELIKRFAATRVIASMQPYHAIDDGRWAEKKIGPQRAKGTYAFRSLLDAGAILTFGSDWNVAPLDPIQGIYAAVTRRTLDGKNPNGWIPEQKITVEEALHCYTANNAYAMFAENELGRIAPGYLADLVVLSDDLFTIAPEKIEGVKVDMTIFDGRVIYERGAASQPAR